MAEFYAEPDARDFSHMPEVARRWGLYVALGVLLLLLGMAAVWYDVFTTVLTVTTLGMLLLVGGVIVLLHAGSSRKWSGFALNFLLGLLYIMLGILLLRNPGIGALSLTMLMAAFFIASGVMRSIIALSVRFSHWGWYLFSGLVSLALGVMIWMQWPLSGLFMIGLFVGIELLLAGWTLIVLGFSARDYSRLHPV